MNALAQRFGNRLLMELLRLRFLVFNEGGRKRHDEEHGEREHQECLVPTKVGDQRLPIGQHDELAERPRGSHDAERGRALMWGCGASDNTVDDRKAGAAERDADEQAAA